MSVQILIGDCREKLAAMDEDSIDSCVCDPPYHLTSIVKRFSRSRSNLEQPADKNLTNIKAGQYKRLAKGFMGQTWDGGDVAFDPATWEAVYRVLKPGAHLIAFSGTRTYHRMVCAIEDAGFEIRDQLAWIYGSGFPKSHDVSKGIDRAAGAARAVVGFDTAKARQQTPKLGTPAFGDYSGDVGSITAPATPEAQQWQGWGTALKPAWEPIVLARKPLIGTVAANVLQHGTGALNIDGCRIGQGAKKWEAPRGGIWKTDATATGELIDNPLGRWPANIIHDGSDEVLAGFPDAPGQCGAVTGNEPSSPFANIYGDMPNRAGAAIPRDDSGSAARFFYSAKATSAERGEGNSHPTVKPVDLMRWLCRLVTPKGGTVLDPFMGSGSTMIAADAEQFNAIGIELLPEYAAIAERRIRDSAGMFAEVQAA